MYIFKYFYSKYTHIFKYFLFRECVERIYLTILINGYITYNVPENDVLDIKVNANKKTRAVKSILSPFS